MLIGHPSVGILCLRRDDRCTIGHLLKKDCLKRCGGSKG